MATKSICNDVRIKNNSLGCGLADALENAKDKKSKSVIMSQKVIRVSPKDIKGLIEK